MGKKNNFLLVDLNETKTKKLAETITSNTSRNILNVLSDKDASATEISKSINSPLPTVHYHLQKLQEAGLVVVETFHYSKKGREVNHYKLANKYIIIAPKKVTGLKEKLKGILPAAILALGAGFIYQISQSFQAITESSAQIAKSIPEMAADATADYAVEAAPLAMERSVDAITTATPLPPLFFFSLGIVATLILYLLIPIIMEKFGNFKKE